MTINFKAPDIKELKPRILVMGLVEQEMRLMEWENGLQGVEFICKYRCSRFKT